MWQSEYEDDGFEESLHKLWKTIEPLYKDLHAYVRSKLLLHYKDKVSRDGPIPAHLLGKKRARLTVLKMKQIRTEKERFLLSLDIHGVWEKQSRSSLPPSASLGASA